MNLNLLACALFGHRYTADAGHEIDGVAAPASCACGMKRPGIVWGKGESKSEPAIDRVQIITAKAGDTIVFMSKEILGADKRRLMAALVTASLPPGVKAIVLEGGMTLAHVEARPAVAADSTLAEKWENSARKQFACAIGTDDPTGKRVMEHGATVYFNCAQELRARGGSSPQPEASLSER